MLCANWGFRQWSRPRHFLPTGGQWGGGDPVDRSGETAPTIAATPAATPAAAAAPKGKGKKGKKEKKGKKGKGTLTSTSFLHRFPRLASASAAAIVPQRVIWVVHLDGAR